VALKASGRKEIRMYGVLLWLMGVPLTVIILLYLIF